MERKHRSHYERAKALASLLIDPTHPPNLADALTENQTLNDAFEKFQEAIYRSEFHGVGGGERAQDLYDRLHAALSDDHVRELVRYSDMMGWEEIAARDAAYLVGVAVGLRMAGGAR